MISPVHACSVSRDSFKAVFHSVDIGNIHIFFSSGSAGQNHVFLDFLSVISLRDKVK